MCGERVKRGTGSQPLENTGTLCTGRCLLKITLSKDTRQPARTPPKNASTTKGPLRQDGACCITVDGQVLSRASRPEPPYTPYLRAPSSPARPLEDSSSLNKSCRYSTSIILKSSPPASAHPPGGGRGIAAWIRRPRTPASPGLRSGPVPPSSICHTIRTTHNTRARTHTYIHWDTIGHRETISGIHFATTAVE